jgi:hypothetical protein
MKEKAACGRLFCCPEKIFFGKRRKNADWRVLHN